MRQGLSPFQVDFEFSCKSAVAFFFSITYLAAPGVQWIRRKRVLRNGEREREREQRQPEKRGARAAASCHRNHWMHSDGRFTCDRIETRMPRERERERERERPL